MTSMSVAVAPRYHWVARLRRAWPTRSVPASPAQQSAELVGQPAEPQRSPLVVMLGHRPSAMTHVAVSHEAPAGQVMTTVVGPGWTFDGDLSSTTGFRLFGRFAGQLELLSAEAVFEVGARGAFNGIAAAARGVIAGVVVGDVVMADVQVREGACVDGEIVYASIDMAPGKHRLALTQVPEADFPSLPRQPHVRSPRAARPRLVPLDQLKTVNARLAPGATFRGSAAAATVGSFGLRVEGDFHGAISTGVGSCVHVASSGCVDNEAQEQYVAIEADYVYIEGSVHGNVVARKCVELGAGARVTGEIRFGEGVLVHETASVGGNVVYSGNAQEVTAGG